MATPAIVMAQHAFPSAELLEGRGAITPSPRADNAAWAYMRAWDLIPDNEERTRFDALMKQEAGAGVSPEQRRALSEHRDFVEGLLHAAGHPSCDWGLHPEKGWEERSGVTGYLRTSWQTLLRDAQRCAADGDTLASAARFAACLRLAVHLSGSRTALNSAYGATMAAATATSFHRALPKGSCTPEAARLMLSALEPVTAAPDPFSLNAAVQEEGPTSIVWLRTQCRGDAAGLYFATMLQYEYGMGSGGGDWIPLPFFARLNEVLFNHELDRTLEYHTQVLQALSSPRRAEAVWELQRQAGEAQWGVLTPLVMPNTRRLIANADSTMQQLKQLEKDLKAIITAPPNIPVPPDKEHE